jgi:hypothetical protein
MACLIGGLGYTFQERELTRKMLLLYATACGLFCGLALILWSQRSQGVSENFDRHTSADAAAAPPLETGVRAPAPEPARESTKALNRLLTGTDDPHKAAAVLNRNRRQTTQRDGGSKWPSHKSVRVALDGLVLVVLFVAIISVSVSDYAIDVSATMANSFPVELFALQTARTHLASFCMRVAAAGRIMVTELWSALRWLW